MEVRAACRWLWGLGAVAVLCPPFQALRGTKVPKILETSSGWASGHGERAAAPTPTRVLGACVAVGWAALLQGDVRTLLVVTSSLLPKVDTCCGVWAGAWQWVLCVFSRSW